MTNHQLFLQYATEGAKMDALLALRLLIKAYISECGLSAGMRTLIYYAAEIWSYWRLPMHPNNPLTLEQIEEEPFVSNMPILSEEYNPDLYDKYDIAPGFDDKALKQLCTQQLDRYDKDTMRALCWGIYFLPKANRHYEKVAYWDKKDVSEYIMKQRKKLQKGWVS